MLLHRLSPETKSLGALAPSLALLSTLLPCLPSAAFGQNRRDTAPPEVHAAPEGEAPTAEPFPGLTIHAEPRPLAADAVVEDWPNFLGPRRDAHTLESPLAKSWDEDGPPLLWEMGRGEGYGSPAILGERLVFTHRVRDEVYVDCLHAATGKRYWRWTGKTSYRDRYLANSGPRSTPTIDGSRVYVHRADGQLLCLDLFHGTLLWKRDLHGEFDVPTDFFGVVSSPLVYGNLLIQMIGAPRGPSVIALDKKSGKLVWGAGDLWGPSCSSPTLAKMHGRERLFVLAGGDSRPPTGGLMVLDPKTGAIDFQYPFRSTTYESVNGATPVVAGERVFVTASYGTGTAALALDKRGGYRELWRTEDIGLQFSNPVFEGGYLYAIDGVSNRPGAIVCMDPKDGRIKSRTDLVWEEETIYKGKERTVDMSVGEGSILFADGAFLCLGDNGHLLWLEAGPDGARVLSRSWLFRADESWTPPVVCRGLLYVCQNTRERFGAERHKPRLLCFDLRAGPESGR